MHDCSLIKADNVRIELAESVKKGMREETHRKEMSERRLGITEGTRGSSRDTDPHLMMQ